MSPLRVTILLHVYARSDRIPNEDCIAQQTALCGFVALGLMVASPVLSGYRLTEKGNALVHRLLAVDPIGDKEPASDPHSPPGAVLLSAKDRDVLLALADRLNVIYSMEREVFARLQAARHAERET